MVYQVSEGHCIPDWKKFLSNTKNKQALISFLGESITKFYNPSNPVPNGNTLYLAGSFPNPEVVKKYLDISLPLLYKQLQLRVSITKNIVFSCLWVKLRRAGTTRNYIKDY